nr:tubulin gamma-1 chain [Tanacetum cinerariifolium]
MEFLKQLVSNTVSLKTASSKISLPRGGDRKDVFFYQADDQHYIPRASLMDLEPRGRGKQLGKWISSALISFADTLLALGTAYAMMLYDPNSCVREADILCIEVELYLLKEAIHVISCGYEDKQTGGAREGGFMVLSQKIFLQDSRCMHTYHCTNNAFACKHDTTPT